MTKLLLNYATIDIIIMHIVRSNPMPTKALESDVYYVAENSCKL